MDPHSANEDPDSQTGKWPPIFFPPRNKKPAEGLELKRSLTVHWLCHLLYVINLKEEGG